LIELLARISINLHPPNKLLREDGRIEGEEEQKFSFSSPSNQWLL
jgi:hypothetical protein